MEKKRILIVDDNVDNVDLLSKRLVPMGFDVDVAYDGVEALERVDRVAPDLIVLDVMMPKMDGFEVCRRIKSDPATDSIPIILLTAKKEIPSKIKGLEIGADDYVTKPFNPKELSARIRGLIKRSHSEKKRATDEKMGALGLMAEGVAHEVRIPMVSIGGFARRIYKQLPEDDPLREYAHHIITEAERLENMVEAIVKFKTLMISPHEKIMVKNLVSEVLSTKRAALEGQGITSQISIDHTLWVNGDRENIVLALDCILENSREAMEDGGEIDITAMSTEEGGITLKVTDTGKGIPKGDLSNIFDPFFTSKMAGAGVGLTMVHRIVTHHGGEIFIDSEEGKFTTVTINLPDGGHETF